MILVTETELYPAMLSIDDKNYILWTGEKLKIHGSSLKGKHMPIVCDEFRDALCLTIFNKERTFQIFKQFRDLSRFPVSAFQIRIYPSKLDYEKKTLYGKLLQQLARASIRVVAGHSLEYIKAVDDYMPVLLVSNATHIDYNYYKDRLAEIASRLLFKPAKALRGLFNSGQNQMEKYM